MSARESLQCDHCEEAAVTSEDGLFTEDMSDRCDWCGFPGHVFVDELPGDEPAAYWVLSDRADAKCGLSDCDECRKVDT